MIEELRQHVGKIVSLLVEGDFEQLETLTRGVRLSAEEIKGAVEQYGRKLVEPPPSAFELMEAIKTPHRWSITMPLWTEEEGQSDLSLELTAIKDGGWYVFELDDIHVL